MANELDTLMGQADWKQAFPNLEARKRAVMHYLAEREGADATIVEDVNATIGDDDEPVEGDSDSDT